MSVTPGGGCDVHARSYRLATADLRDVGACEAALRAAGCEANVPTLLLSECVLVYMPKGEVTGLVQRYYYKIPDCVAHFS